MTRYAVVQDEYRPDDWQAVAQLVTDQLGLHLTTARQRARKTPGFVAEGLDQRQAQQLQQACQACDMPVHVVEEKDLAILPKPARLHHLWLREDALWIRRAPTGPLDSIAWDTIAVIAACRATQQETRMHWSAEARRMNQGISAALEVSPSVHLKAAQQTQEFVEYVADIIAWLPGGAVDRLRLNSRELNYQEALGADAPDPQTVPQARILGFIWVLARIQAQAVRALVPPDTAALLRDGLDKTRRPDKLQGLEEFDAYNRWLLQKSRCEPAGPMQPPPDPNPPLR